MVSQSQIYKERLRQRQLQEHADKGKVGLGRKTILDYTRAAGKSINEWSPRYKPEENAFDILPFVITQSWYPKLRMPSGRVNGLDVGMWDYKLQVPIHRGIVINNDSLLCLREAFGQECKICDDMFEAYKAGDKDKAKDLRPSWRCFYNIYDYDDVDKGIQLFEISYLMFEAPPKNNPQRSNLIDAMYLSDGGVEVFYDLEEGKTIVAKFLKRVLGKVEFPELDDIKFESREKYEQDVLQKVYPLDSMLVIPTPEEVKNIYMAVEDDEQSQEEKPEQSSSQTNRRSRTTETSTETNEEPVRGRQRNISGSTQRPKHDIPPWDKDGNWGQYECPAGKKFGEECNSGPECEGKTDNACSEETFAKCSEAYAEYQESLKKEPEEPPVEKTEKEQEKSEQPVRRRRR